MYIQGIYIYTHIYRSILYIYIYTSTHRAVLVGQPVFVLDHLSDSTVRSMLHNARIGLVDPLAILHQRPVRGAEHNRNPLFGAWINEEPPPHPKLRH